MYVKDVISFFFLFSGLETANLTIDKLKKQAQDKVVGIVNRPAPGPDVVSVVDPNEYQFLHEQVKEANSSVEELERTTKGLNNQIAEFKFQLR